MTTDPESLAPGDEDDDTGTVPPASPAPVDSPSPAERADSEQEPTLNRPADERRPGDG